MKRSYLILWKWQHLKLCILTKKDDNVFGTAGNEVIILGIRTECYFSPHPAAEPAENI